MDREPCELTNAPRTRTTRRTPLGRAVFLDRDGTLVNPRAYPASPRDLRLYATIAPELRALQAAGFTLVVITNQSGLARGLFDEAALARMHAYLAQSLHRRGVRLDGIYHCPHHPDGVRPELSVVCQCRKPAPGLILDAADRHQIDVARSWMVGDTLSDVAAGRQAGCRTVLVDLGTEPRPERDLETPEFVGRDTRHALQIVRAVEGLGAEIDLDYRPSRWAGGASAGSRASERILRTTTEPYVSGNSSNYSGLSRKKVSTARRTP